MTITKSEQITHVLKDLMVLRESTQDPKKLRAIDDNAAFFEACRSVFKYFIWLIRRAPKLEPENLQEINDLLPKYDAAMHGKLIEMEKKKFPGLIKLLVDRLKELILASHQNLVIANFGSGGMEAERQVIATLIAKADSRKIIFIGIDQSDDAHNIAKKNLSGLAEHIQEFAIDQLDDDKLNSLKNEVKKIGVVYCQNNIFELEQHFTGLPFNISFHSLFRHHLNSSDWKKMEDVIRKLSAKVIEYDGYKSWLSMIPQTLIGWGNPVFLNAEIFSNLRFPPKSKVKYTHKNNKITFSKIGYYMLEY